MSDVPVLIVDDDHATRLVHAGFVARAGLAWHAVDSADAALAFVRSRRGPTLLLLDWTMPGMNGPDLCRLFVTERIEPRPYVIMVTLRDSTGEIADGLDAGADDFVTKPADGGELLARVRVGLRTIALRESLRQRLLEVQSLNGRVQQLESLLPVCAYCRRIGDGTTWQTMEAYLAERASIRVSHGCCPDCLERLQRELP